jgi:hypothetical protein
VKQQFFFNCFSSTDRISVSVSNYIIHLWQCWFGCSEVIKGLVFKKNTAHKHMPTNCHNPRLLLLKGVLGHSDIGLSSFSSMDQVRYYILYTYAVRK